ncbi:hypothetical protein FRC03_000768 [Tulasnella sp. 419]|nr:hypothetical protein FRC03_000768 [Tulasnella sp. 419]
MIHHNRPRRRLLDGLDFPIRMVSQYTLQELRRRRQQRDARWFQRDVAIAQYIREHYDVPYPWVSEDLMMARQARDAFYSIAEIAEEALSQTVLVAAGM